MSKALSQFKCLGAVMDFDQMDDKMIELDDASCFCDFAFCYVTLIL